MAERAPDEAFPSDWLSLPVALYLAEQAPGRPPVTIEIHSGEESMLIESVDGEIRTRPDTADHPDAVLTGPPQLILGVLSGLLDPEEAQRRGLRYEGDPAALRGLRRQAPPAG